MNVLSRGVKNTLRSPIRSGAIILMLAISIALIVAMLVARAGVEAKITNLKKSTATTITINPAGIQGGMGGGDLLSADQLQKVRSTPHVSSASGTLIDQLGSTDTNLTSSLTLGNFGRRQLRFEALGMTNSGTQNPAHTGTRPTLTPHISVIGTTNPTSISGPGGNTIAVSITKGSTIDGSGTNLVALVGTSLATKNNLLPGSTFTAYGKTITVSGIYSTKNTFEDSGLIMPLQTVQSSSGQTGYSSIQATASSSDVVGQVVSALTSELGSSADITSSQAQAQASVDSLQSISSLATAGVIASAIAGAVIIFLMMILVVRERRREIGVIKAIGGTNRIVALQFVIEALTLTIVSACIGFCLGVAVSGGMTQALVTNQVASSQTAPTVGSFGGGSRQFGGGFAPRRRIQAAVSSVTSAATPEVFATAIGITLLIAIIGSAVPAWLISRVRPAEVLRAE